jgi:hypothetical protein
MIVKDADPVKFFRTDAIDSRSSSALSGPMMLR